MPEHPYADVYAPLAQRITQARLERGMTQADLGAATGMGRTAITMIELTRQSVAVHQLLAIARALDVDACRLLGCDCEAGGGRREAGGQEEGTTVATTDARLDDLAARVRSLERALHRAGLSELG